MLGRIRMAALGCVRPRLCGRRDGEQRRPQGTPRSRGPRRRSVRDRGGLTCVLSESLTRSAVFGALKKRRCYGTTGPRISLDFTADGHPMGSVLDVTSPARLAASVVGTAPIEALQLFQGKEVLFEVRPPEFADLTASRRIRVSWGGSRIRGRGRRATWDGSIRVEGNSILRGAFLRLRLPSRRDLGRR